MLIHASTASSTPKSLIKSISSNMEDILPSCIFSSRSYDFILHNPNWPIGHKQEQEAKVREELRCTTNLVQIKGSSRFCNIAWQMGSSGIRTPTCLLFAYLVEEPCFMHCLGNSLLAGKIIVYCRSPQDANNQVTRELIMNRPQYKVSNRISLQGQVLHAWQHGKC